MVAVDTNVLVRLLTGDEPRQSAAARSLFAHQKIWIAKSVLLETACVLGSLYAFEQEAIRVALVKLLGLKNVQAEDQPAVAEAFDLWAKGVDFADALHLSSRPPDAAFVSFDRAFVKRAQRAGAPNVSSAAPK